MTTQKKVTLYVELDEANIDTYEWYLRRIVKAVEGMRADTTDVVSAHLDNMDGVELAKVE